jgi:hypothetical protein
MWEESPMLSQEETIFTTVKLPTAKQSTENL